MEKGILHYTNFFRDIAIKHKQIAHIQASESADYPTKRDRHFVLFSTDEVIAGLRSSISDGIVLFLHPYVFKGGEGEAGTTFKSTHECRFLVCEKVNNDDIDAQVVSFDKTETIVWDIIRKIYQQSNGAGPNCPYDYFKNMSLSNFSVEPISHIFEGRFGWYVSFYFDLKRTKFMTQEFTNDQVDNPFTV